MRDIIELGIAIVALIILILVSLYASIKLDADTYAGGEDLTEYFLDENLKNAIIELAEAETGESNKKRIFESDLQAITQAPGGTSLKLSGKGIKDLSGLELFANYNITWIFLDWNEIEDISVIENFKNLTKISFSGNNVKNISPLATLENLSSITAINNQIETIEQLGNLKRIENINLDGNKIENISVVTEWENLVDMSFQNNNILSIPDFSNLKKLKQINLSSNKLETISTMGSVEKLEKIEIDSNNLTSLDGIQNNLSITYLSCCNNNINQLNGIENLNNLENINLNKNDIKDISIIGNNKQLKYIYMDANMIQDFEVLKELPNLEKYTLYNQSYFYLIDQKPEQDTIQINLPVMYTQLHNQDSFIYKEQLNQEVSGTENYQIDETNSIITIPVQDVEKDNIVLKVSDDYNTIMQFIIELKEEEPFFEINDYEIEDNQIKNIQPNTTYADLKDNIKTNMEYLVKDGENVIDESDILKTGQILKTGDNHYSIVVIGDTNADGKSDIKDILNMNKHRLNKENLLDAYFSAGDINKDEKVDIRDILQVNKYRLKKIKQY